MTPCMLSAPRLTKASSPAVASLWCALGIRDITETAGETEFTIDYMPELFPRLTYLEEIAHMLAERA